MVVDAGRHRERLGDPAHRLGRREGALQPSGNRETALRRERRRVQALLRAGQAPPELPGLRRGPRPAPLRRQRLGGALVFAPGRSLRGELVAVQHVKAAAHHHDQVREAFGLDGLQEQGEVACALVEVAPGHGPAHTLLVDLRQVAVQPAELRLGFRRGQRHHLDAVARRTPDAGRRDGIRQVGDGRFQHRVEAFSAYVRLDLRLPPQDVRAHPNAGREVVFTHEGVVLGVGLLVEVAADQHRPAPPGENRQ